MRSPHTAQALAVSLAGTLAAAPPRLKEPASGIKLHQLAKGPEDSTGDES